MKKIFLVIACAMQFAVLYSQDFTFGTMPDTQELTVEKSDAERITEMTQWYVDNRDSLNLKFVASLGDMTQWGADYQWEYVRESYNVFKDAGLPYAPCQGNHDPSLSKMNDYFPVSEFDTMAMYGGHLGGMYNSYFLFNEAGVDYIIVVIQSHDQYVGSYNMESIEWANEILEKYKTRRAIFVTHDFFENKGLIKDVITKHDNLFLALCGHSCAREQYWTEKTPNGSKVHCIMADYQCDSDKGATLRYYKFMPDKDTICAYTYNITNQEYERDWNSEFKFKAPVSVPEQPVIERINNWPVYPKSNELATVFATITDDKSVSSTTINFGSSPDNLINLVSMSGEDYNYEGKIPPNKNGDTVYYSITVMDNDENYSTSNVYSYKIVDDESTLPCPYNGVQVPFENVIYETPCFIEAEDFNHGCQGIAYFDLDEKNKGNKYRRTDAVDIKKGENDHYYISYINKGEWVNYNINVQLSGEYTFGFRAGSAVNGGMLHLEIDSVDISGPVEFSKTGGYEVWEYFYVHNIWLDEGPNTIRVCFDKGAFSFNSFGVVLTSEFEEFVHVNTIEKQQIKLYPNPTKGILHLECNNNVNEVEIFNLLGQKENAYALIKTTNGYRLNVNNLAQGVYFIKPKNSIELIKFIKE